MYASLAAVYDFLTPEALLRPENAAEAFAPWLPERGALLDCACGPGTRAVGLARRGYAVEASDASPEMIALTRAAAERHGVTLPAEVRRWEALAGPPRYDAVLCVGNSLTHAPDRVAALTAMAGVLRPGGRLLLSSRNWARERAAGSRLDVDERLTERGGRRALVVRAWEIAAEWDAPHALDVAVAVLGDGGAVDTARERLTFYPFTPETLDADLRAAGLTPDHSTFTPEVARYLVCARL